MLVVRLQIIPQFLFRLLELSSYLFKSTNSFHITFYFVFCKEYFYLLTFSVNLIGMWYYPMPINLTKQLTPKTIKMNFSVIKKQNSCLEILAWWVYICTPSMSILIYYEKTHGFVSSYGKIKLNIQKIQSYNRQDDN